MIPITENTFDFGEALNGQHGIFDLLLPGRGLRWLRSERYHRPADRQRSNIPWKWSAYWIDIAPQMNIEIPNDNVEWKMKSNRRVNLLEGLDVEVRLSCSNTTTNYQIG
jgi:hypothetical protein